MLPRAIRGSEIKCGSGKLEIREAREPSREHVVTIVAKTAGTGPVYDPGEIAVSLRLDMQDLETLIETLIEVRKAL